MADLNKELRGEDLDAEKSSGIHEEQVNTNNSEAESTDPRITCFTHAEQRKIVHRIDRRLVVTVGIMYSISLMDRTNLSAANIAGLVVPIVILWPGC